MAVLPAVREGEPCRIVEPGRCAVYHFGHERERLQRARAELFHQEQLGEVAEIPLVRQGQDRSQPPRLHVPWPHVVVAGHLQPPDGGHRAVRVILHDRKQGVLRRAGARVHQVLNHALVHADDGRVWIRGEVPDGRGVPVVAAGQPAGRIHALLHDGPVAICGDDERVEVDLEAVGDGVVIDARREAAGPHEGVPVDADPVGDDTEFLRRTQ